MAAVLDFGNSNFLTVWTVKRPILRIRAKFRDDQPICCCDIAIFVVFKMATAAILVFEKFEILTVCPRRGPICVTVPNFIEIGQTVAEMWRFELISCTHVSVIYCKHRDRKMR